MRGGFWAVLVAAAIVCSSAVARAQCTKDTDCKGERVCEAGQCTGPAPSAAPATPVPPQPQEAPPAEPNLAPRTASRPARVLSPEPELEPDQRFFTHEEPRKPAKRLRSPGMMAGGIVLTSLGPVLLMAGVLSSSCPGCSSGPRMLAFVLGAATCIGIGVPLIVMGAKRVPVHQVTLAPWLAPRQAGMQLQLSL